MDDINLLTTIDAVGGLPPNPRVRVKATLLAVAASDNTVKLLATTDGLCLMHTFGNCSFDTSRVASETLTKVQVFVIPQSNHRRPCIKRRYRSPAITLKEMEEATNKFRQSGQLSCPRWDDYAATLGKRRYK